MSQLWNHVFDKADFKTKQKQKGTLSVTALTLAQKCAFQMCFTAPAPCAYSITVTLG